MKRSTLTLIFIGVFVCSFAQKKKKERPVYPTLVYADVNYQSSIHTVEFHNASAEQSLPVIHLGSDDQLLLHFDDLRDEFKSMYVGFEHCDAQWNKSNLQILEYSDGFSDERIRDVTQSHNTYQSFVHYAFSFPTQNLKPKISGNYILKVYEDGDVRKLVFSRRFYVVDPKVTIEAELVPAVEVQKRKTHQKLNIRVNTQTLKSSNPFLDFTIKAMQNQRPDRVIIEQKPGNINGNVLTYALPHQFNFPAGNEFITLDMRSLRLNSERIKNVRLDEMYRIDLFNDRPADFALYSRRDDENGRFYIRNQDQEDQVLASDYGLVQFSLEADSTTGDSYYVVGKFNQYQQIPNNRMHFDAVEKTWKSSLRLKQGVYDYTYVRDRESASSVLKDHFETENEYQILIYYKNPTTFRDELVGYTAISNDSRENNRIIY